MEWLTYLLKVSACLGLFYAFYHFGLQRLTFFSTNRIYLLSTLVISFIIPAMQLQVQRSAIQPAQVNEVEAVHSRTFSGLNNPVAASPDSFPNAVEPPVINWQEVLFACYWLIVIIMLTIFAFQAFQLLKYTRKVSQKVGRLKVVFKPEGFTNCSFLNYVFVNQQELSDEEIGVILQHERVHVLRYHSVDKLLLSACRALLWFNPVIYLYDKALEQTHEYEADKETSMAIGNTPYADVLLAMAVRNKNPSLAHSFVKNPLKERIKMLFTNPSKNMKKLTYLLVLPLGVALIWTFAVQVVYASLPVVTIKHTEMKPVPIEKIPLQVIEPDKEIETEKPILPAAPPDTLWMLSSRNLNRYSEVVIDGKSYGIDILTKISPSCLKSIKYGRDKIEITTKNDRIEYATKIDRQNAIARDKARAPGNLYTRYTQKTQDGSRYDYIEIVTKGGSGGGVGVDRGKKLLLIYEGKKYSERKFKALTNEQLINRGMRFSSLGEQDEGKFGKGYGAKIEIFKPEQALPSDTVSIKESYPKGVFRKPMGFEINDAFGKFSYSAQDSTIYMKGLGDVMLYGDVKMDNDQLSIKADKIRFNGTNHTAIAKNVSFTKKGNAEIKDAAFVKFNLRAGTYEVLQELKGF